jgi:hypothetical protein
MTHIRDSLAARDHTALIERLGANTQVTPYSATERETGSLLYALRTALTSHSIDAEKSGSGPHFISDLQTVNRNLREVLRFLKGAGSMQVPKL